MLVFTHTFRKMLVFVGSNSKKLIFNLWHNLRIATKSKKNKKEPINMATNHSNRMVNEHERELNDLIEQQQRKLDALRAKQAQEKKEAKERQIADARDFALLAGHHEAMYSLFSTILIRALTPIRAGGYAFANSGSLSRICGNLPEGSFFNTGSDGFLKRMVTEGLIRRVTKTKATGTQGKQSSHHYFYIGMQGVDIESWKEENIKTYLI